MGAALAIPLLIIVVLAVGYVIWALLAAARGAASVAKDQTTGETAAHHDPTAPNNVSTTPPTDHN
ncbi:hypothetical protein ACI2LF_34680 [Kribbella sp. NPDC020789]